MRRVVLRRGCLDGARPRQPLPVQLIIRDGRKRVELFAIGERVFSVFGEQAARVVAVRVRDDERRAPRERAHDAIGVARGELSFLDLYPAFEQLDPVTSAKKFKGNRAEGQKAKGEETEGTLRQSELESRLNGDN